MMQMPKKGVLNKSMQTFHITVAITPNVVMRSSFIFMKVQNEHPDLPMLPNKANVMEGSMRLTKESIGTLSAILSTHFNIEHIAKISKTWMWQCV